MEMIIIDNTKNLINLCSLESLALIQAQHGLYRSLAALGMMSTLLLAKHSKYCSLVNSFLVGGVRFFSRSLFSYTLNLRDNAAWMSSLPLSASNIFFIRFVIREHIKSM